jgi:glutathione reductase (NADPH)
MTGSYDFDLFVIGAGSGGVRAARVTASHGAKVAIAEEHRVGGTCVIRGCVPKKLLVYAARLGAAMEDAEGFGWSIDNRRFSWQKLLANKDREIDRLNGIYTQNLEKSGVKIYSERAVLADNHTVRLKSSGDMLTAKTILIATGSRPFVPDFPGHEYAITSNEALHLPELPTSIVIVGGGYIALEFASIFAGLGSTVTMLYRGPQILRGFDADLRTELSAAMQERGIDLRVNTDIATIYPEADGYRADFAGDGGSIMAEKIMYATGRVPNTSGLGLEKTGIERGENGYVVVDEYSRTSASNIYAIGDATHHKINLTPVAISEAMAFAETVFNNNPTPVDHSFIASAVFSEPEVGTVGMTEEEARKKFHTVDIYKSKFRPMLHTLSGRNEKMLMKLVVDGESGKVVGCHVMGPDAAEIVQMAAIPIRMGARKVDFDNTMALHPSAAEELVTMREKWSG